MSSLDILVLSAIALTLCYPQIRTALNSMSVAAPVATQETKEQWRQRWTHTLIELLGDLDKEGHKAGSALCRDLMWEILGGEQAGGKK